MNPEIEQREKGEVQRCARQVEIGGPRIAAGGLAKVARMRSVLWFAAALAMGCTSPLPEPAHSPQPQTALVVVPYEPPPGRVEIVPTRPRSDAVWIDGEWNWTYRRWAWTPGRWVVPPPHATYSPWVTVRGRDATLYFAPAVWRDEQGRALSPPPPLAIATVATIPVVEADGTQARTTVKLSE